MRRRPDRRRRHRRPHGPGQPPGVLGAARLLVRAGTAGTLTIAYAAGDPKQITVTVAADATIQQIADAINSQDRRPGRRRRRQERPRRGPARAVLAHDRLDLGLHGHERRRARRRRRLPDARRRQPRRLVLARRRPLRSRRRRTCSRTRSPACASRSRRSPPRPRRSRSPSPTLDRDAIKDEDQGVRHGLQRRRRHDDGASSPRSRSPTRTSEFQAGYGRCAATSASRACSATCARR